MQDAAVHIIFDLVRGIDAAKRVEAEGRAVGAGDVHRYRLARLQVGDRWLLTLECGTQAERQLEPNADWRLNNAFQQTIWPDDQGLIYVDGVARKKEWRSRPESPGLFKRLLKVFSPLIGSL